MAEDKGLPWRVELAAQLAWRDDILLAFNEVRGSGFVVTIFNGDGIAEEEQHRIASEAVQAIRAKRLH